jgi:Family of unknown function (DUF5689)
MNTFKKFIAFSFPIMIMLFVTSCVDQEFDEPPIDGEDPTLTVTHTIDQIKGFFVAGTATALPDTAIISGIVISDDVQGNFYKDLVIADSSGGILIRIDVSPLSPIYGKGRRVFIKLGGLFISDYGGMIQLGVKDGAGVGRIPSTLVDSYVIRGKWNQPFPVREISSILSVDPNNRTNQNIAVRFKYARFVEVCDTWADVASGSSGNRTLRDSSGNSITIRTSNFSTFASATIPGDTGTVEGILQVFNGGFQLIIRDLNDLIDFLPPVCASVNSIQELRAIYGGSARTIPNNSTIEGVVISDKVNGNITANNVVIQQGDYGIVVRFTSPNTFSTGDKIRVNISNQELSEFNSLLQVNNVDITLATLTGTGTVTPRIATTADINSNGETWESTLVQINGATLSGGTAGAYGGTVTITDAAGTLPMFTRSAALFAGTLFPTTTVSVTGYIGDFNGRQLNIRDANDVQ